MGPDACLLFLLGWSSARESTCLPRRIGIDSLLAAGGWIILALTFLGEPGLWLLAGVDALSTLRLEDVVGALDVDGDVDVKLPSTDQVVLTMGSKLLMPGTKGMEALLYCGMDVGDTIKLSMLTLVAGWAAHGSWWNPGTPPPPGPGTAGRSKRASKRPGSIGIGIGIVLSLSNPKEFESGG